MSEAFPRADGVVKAMFPAMSVSRRARLIRAVLEAVREPDEVMKRRGGDCISPDRDPLLARAAWRAMIDALIIQAPDIPVVGKLVTDSEGPYTKQLREEAGRQFNDTATGEVTE